MENICRRHLLKLATKFAELNDLSLKTVSRRFHGAVSFMEDFRAGRVTVTLSKYDEMVAQFRREWPDGKKFPK